METRIEIHEVVSTVVSSLRTSIHNLGVRNFNRNPPTIHQTPIYVWKGNKSAYAPMFVSIGPYHRDHEQIRGMKILYLKNFLGMTGNNMETYASLIASREEEARDCYHDRCNRLGSKEFVQMMVLDGCFIIEFLLKFKENTIDPSFMNKNGRDLRNDLTLMENQIPFFILKLILDNSGVGLPEILDLCLFFLHGSKITKDMLEQTHQEGDGKNVYHLLHLSYLCHMIEIIPEMETPPETLQDHLIEKTKKLFCSSVYCVILFPIKCFLILFFFALILLFEFIKIANKIMWKKPNIYNRQRVRAEQEEKAKTIPTATELNEYGVTFKRKKDANNFLLSFQPFLLTLDTNSPAQETLIMSKKSKTLH